MTDDPSTRAALQIALQSALRDRDLAEATISYLSEKLGLSDTGTLLASGNGAAPEEEGPRDVGPVLVAEGEFYGMSQTKAAYAFLERGGRSRPQRTEQIIAAIAKGGVKVGGKDPAATFYKVLNRDPRFHRPAPNTWGLSQWYPGAQKRAKAEQEASAAEERADAADDADAGSETPSEEEQTQGEE